MAEYIINDTRDAAADARMPRFRYSHEAPKYSKKTLDFYFELIHGFDILIIDTLHQPPSKLAAGIDKYNSLSRRYAQRPPKCYLSTMSAATAAASPPHYQ